MSHPGINLADVPIDPRGLHQWYSTLNRSVPPLGTVRDLSARGGDALLYSSAYVSDKRISIPYPAKLYGPSESLGLNVPGRQLTIACWARPLVSIGTTVWSSWVPLVTRHSGPSSAEFALSFAGSLGVLLAVIGATSGQNSGTAQVQVLGEWLHIVVCWTVGIGTDTYLNGTLAASESFSTVPSGAYTGVTQWGRWNQVGKSLNGDLDDCMLWDRLLSAGEARSLYDWSKWRHP